LPEKPSFSGNDDHIAQMGLPICDPKANFLRLKVARTRLFEKERIMGWGRTLLLGDVGNRLDIEDCERDISELHRLLNEKRSTLHEQNDEINDLRAENEELKLYMASIIKLLISKSVFTQEEFSRFVDIIDQSDGTGDGRFTGDI
jgi:hypothetical protein